MIKRVHHIGIAVNKLKESAALFEKLLGVKPHFHRAPSQKVTEAAFEVGGGAEIDLVEPTGPESAVAKFLKNRGEGLHHVALEVDDINKELKTCRDMGVNLIDKEGREGVAGLIGFLHPKSLAGVMVELLQPRRKRNQKEMMKKIHHIGIVVKNLDEAVALYSQVLGGKPVSLAEIPEGKVRIANFRVGETALEFLEGAAGSPLADFAARRGEGLHHIAVEVDDIAGELKRLEASGVTLMDKEPRPGPVGKIAFVGPEGAYGVSIELVQPEKKRKLPDNIIIPAGAGIQGRGNES